MKNIKDFILEAQEKSITIRGVKITLDDIAEAIDSVARDNDWDRNGVLDELEDNSVMDWLEYHGQLDKVLAELADGLKLGKLSEKEEEDICDFGDDNSDELDEKVIDLI